MSYVGTLIRDTRVEKGITQVTLAEKAGVSRRQLQRIEADEVDSTFDTVFKLMSALRSKRSSFRSES